MRRLLLVDDEERVTSGLQRRLSGLLKNFQIITASGGKQGLEIMDHHHIDFVVSDLMMPEMDGATFLEKTQAKYPHTIRVVLSGQADKDLFLKASSVVHQHISKPCDGASLATTIEQITESTEEVAQEALQKTLAKVHQLPTLAQSQYDLISVLESNEESISIISEMIKKDPAITAKIMKAANSSFFGVGGRITSIEDALMILGVDIVKCLVIVVSFSETIKIPASSGLSLETHGEHSIGTSLALKKLGIRNGIDAKLISEAFTVAVLHDIGKLILAHVFAEKYKEACDESLQTKVPLWQVEKKLFGNCHAEVGAHLLKIWGLPNSIVEAVRFHHTPHLKENFQEISATSMVHLADYLENKKSARNLFTPGDVDIECIQSFKEAKEIEKNNDL